MKTKNIFLTLAIAAFVFSFTSCKKDTSTGAGSSTGADAKTQSDDQTFYTNETDYATNDANAAMNNAGGSYNQRPEGYPIAWPCDTASVVVDTVSSTANHSITITYNGSACGVLYNHRRTGNITLSFSPNFKWGTAGSALTITFNLNSVRITDGKTVNIKGTRVITNTTGGLLRNLASLDSIGYSITDNTTVTFDNGSQRSWQTSLHRTYTYNLTNLGSITIVGSLSGTNRFGESFSANIVTPLVVTGCSGFRYTSGQISYTGGAGGTSTTTFGLDSNGDPTTGCVTGTLYYTFAWVGPNNGKFNYTGNY